MNEFLNFLAFRNSNLWRFKF